MKITKSRRFGFCMVDNRVNDGVSPELLRSVGKADSPTAGAGELFEADFYLCNHWPCQAQVIINPLRTRERAWCMSCDRYICDTCGAAMRAGAVCVPVQMMRNGSDGEIAKALYSGNAGQGPTPLIGAS